VKQIAKPVEFSQNGDNSADWKNEYAAMSAVNSRFIVQLLDYFDDADDGYIVMEYCSGGNLRQLLKAKQENGEELSEEVCDLDYLCLFTLGVAARCC
jgi:serine/threonine protein kinase